MILKIFVSRKSALYPGQLKKIGKNANEGYDANVKLQSWRKIFDNLTSNMIILEIKARIERNGGGIKAQRTRLYDGDTELLNLQKLGDFLSLSDRLEGWEA